MEFRKITITLPKSLYDEAVALIDRGLFSNFSDLIRSGIREEFKGLNQVVRDFDERNIYGDRKLIAGVKQSQREARAGKGKLLRTNAELRSYLKQL